MRWKFKVGDRVLRRACPEVCWYETKDRTGRVVRRFSDHESHFGPYPELYEVEFEDGKKEVFLPHGIELHEKAP